MMIQGHRVKKIGAGEFCTAYRSYDDPAVVFLLTPYDVHESENLYTKEIYAHVDSVHIPYMSMVDDVTIRGKEYVCFETRYSNKLTTKHKEAWELAKILQQTWDTYISRIKAMQYKGEYDRLYTICFDFIEEIKADDRIPESLKDALEYLYTWCTAYGGNVIFEFPTRNLAVSEGGTLILRDIVFFRNAKKYT